MRSCLGVQATTGGTPATPWAALRCRRRKSVMRAARKPDLDRVGHRVSHVVGHDRGAVAVQLARSGTATMSSGILGQEERDVQLVADSLLGLPPQGAET